MKLKLSKYFIAVTCITVAGFAIRLSLIPFDEVVSNDALLYLKYGHYYSTVKFLPHSVTPLHNTGWSVFLSGLFRFVNVDYLVFSNIQRVASVVFSTLTIPIVYLICKRFFVAKYSLIGAGLFAFDWRIIQNSAFGITEPLFLLLSFTGFLFAFNRNKSIAMLSIILVGMSMIIRFEGILMLLLVCAVFLYNGKFKTNIIIRTSLMLSILIIPTWLVTNFNVSNNMPDGLVSNIIKEITFFIEHINDFDIGLKIYNSVLHLGWSTFPNYFFLLPIGIYSVMKSRQNRWLVLALVLLVFSGLWAYIDAFDTRYFFQSYIVMILLSLFGLAQIRKITISQKVVLK